MSIQIKNKYIILGILVAFSLLFILGYINGHRRADRSNSLAISSLKQEISRLTVEIDEKTVYLSKVEQDLTTEKELRKADIIDKETYRKLYIKKVDELTKAQLKIDTLLQNVSHNGQIIEILNSQIANYKNTSTDKQKAILLPFTFEKKDNWLDLKGQLNKDGVLGIDLKMDASIDVITGIDKDNKSFCILKTDNQYIKTLSLASYKTDPPKKLKYGIGIQFGYGLILKKEPQLCPFVGIGVSRNLIKF